MSSKGNYIPKWYTEIADKNAYKISLQIAIDKQEVSLKAICPAYADKITEILKSQYEPGYNYVEQMDYVCFHLLQGDDPETIISELTNTK